MDLETLFYIAIAAFYLLSRVMGGGKKKKGPKGKPKRPTPDRAPRPSTSRETGTVERSGELEDALREIRAALGWEVPEPKPAPPPVTVPPPVETPPPVPVRRPEQPPATRQVPSQARKTLIPGPAVAPAAPALATKPIAPLKPSASVSMQADDARTERVEQMRKLLRNPATAREAFLMSEIFARRGRRR